MANGPGRTLWLDHLRTTLTMLVVAHHATLSYTTFATFHKETYILSTHPVVDDHRWVGLDIFENFNDVFFMSLMFFISGVFVLPALQKKGVSFFLRDRLYRLFIPFLVAVSLLMLLAYYPAYLQAYGKHDPGHYIIDFFTTEQWPVGPPWFIWVLFAFNVLIALVYPALGSALVSAGRALSKVANKPGRLFGCWFLFTFLLYVPIAAWIGPGTWTGIGPFDFQLSRIGLYFGYFVLGVIAGSAGPSGGLLSTSLPATRRWPWLLAICGLVYTVLTLAPPHLEQWVKTGQLSKPFAWFLYFSLYVASCTASCLAFLFTFKAIVHKERPLLRSLTANAYGIYLVHYVFITWCQYLLLPLAWPALIKFGTTFILSLLLSWGAVALLRHNKWLGKYL